LSQAEIAYALGYALTDGGPDKEIFADLSAGKLGDPAVIQAHVERFYESAITGTQKRKGKAERVLRFIAYIRHVPARPGWETIGSYNVSKKQVREDNIISGEKNKNNQRYVMRLSGQRAGILSQPSWLTAHSTNFDNDPVKRGKWVYEHLLGGIIPNVPITVDATVPEDPDKTLRERFQKTEENYCMKCHQKMNPLGMAFEMFDDVGRFREKELLRDNKSLVEVDSSGGISHSGVPGLDGPVDNALDLMEKLANSSHVRQVFVRHAFRYWMGRNETLSDSPTLIAADKAYVESGGSMKALVASLLSSDSFLYRKDPASPN